MLTRFIPAIFVLLWSTGFITSKLAMPHAEPFSFLFVRFGAVMLVLAAVSLLLRAEWPRSRAALHGMVSGTLLHGAYLGGVFWAISHGMSSGISALIVSTQPILTAVLAPVVVGERVGWRHWLGLALGLAGVVMVLLPQIAQNSAGVELPTIAAAVVGLLGITFGNLYQKRFATALDLRTGGVCQFAGATLATLICAIASESGRIDWVVETWVAMLWSIFVLSIGAITLLMVMLRDGAISKVSTYFYMVPPVTALMAWAMFGETMSGLQFAGLALTSLAVLIVSNFPQRPPNSG